MPSPTRVHMSYIVQPLSKPSHGKAYDRFATAIVRVAVLTHASIQYALPPVIQQIDVCISHYKFL